MKADQATIAELHQTYCRLSGMEVALRFNRESSWVEFIRAGFTAQDLEAVIKRLLSLVKQGDRRTESLKFSNVVQGLDRFEEELAMIKAEANGLIAVERPLSVMELQRVIEAKTVLANRIEDTNATRDAFGLTWHDANAREDYLKIKGELRDLTRRMAQMA